ncbi:phosphoenolpyruvate phosphomutase-domain-containing protein [Xylariales sp. PMI_506]|nr:phosphoenolpyruvate phosphomutase-domain-containing protein [Xylariales sp. PMI_506]
MTTNKNNQATRFKALHEPGRPLILANVYDILSAEAVAQLPSCKALATASFAVARAWGTTDGELTLDTNLQAVRGIADVAARYNLPLTVDLQDGYGDRLEEAIRELLALGVSGVNLEDRDKATLALLPPATAVERIKRVLAVAASEGVPDFVVNARCDVLLTGGEMPELISRGKLYLDAGATTIFVLGGAARGVSRAEVAQMAESFGGRLNVSKRMGPGYLTIKELEEIGVARISIGPQLQIATMDYLAKEAAKLLEQEA